MGYIPLTDEETRVIFAGETTHNLRTLDASPQEQVLRRLLSIVESESPPSSFVHETIGNLDIITAGGQCRLYTKTVDRIPRGNTEYHAVYLFYIDSAHDYQETELATYSTEAELMLEQATSLETIPDVERYFENNDALGEDDFRDLLS